jgi:hypothetical protein
MEEPLQRSFPGVLCARHADTVLGHTRFLGTQTRRDGEHMVV